MKKTYTKVRFNHNISKLIQARRISPRKLAGVTGTARTSIEDWISGKTKSPQADRRLYKVAKRLGVTVDQLCFGKV